MANNLLVPYKQGLLKNYWGEVFSFRELKIEKVKFFTRSPTRLFLNSFLNLEVA